MSCAKMAEPLKMQFGMLSQTSQGNMYYMGRTCNFMNDHKHWTVTYNKTNLHSYFHNL